MTPSQALILAIQSLSSKLAQLAYYASIAKACPMLLETDAELSQRVDEFERVEQAIITLKAML